MQVQMTARLNQGAFAAVLDDLNKRYREMATAEMAARKKAATVATRVTRDSFRYTGRPVDVPERQGRKSTHGQLANHLHWNATSGIGGGVEFDVIGADHAAWYWIILEIGSGERAVLRRGGDPNPRGRPHANASFVRSVKSQRGRLISIGLGFASGPGGVYTPPGGQRDQQLYLRSQLVNRSAHAALSGAAPRQRGIDQLVIKHEIHGQHFVKKGGTTAFREYSNTVLAAARRAFDGRG